MAFLGGLGKTLGLNKQFVEGLAGGFASSVDTKIKKDMEMTQNNIDDLTKIAFESTATDKKRFDKELKENTELVEEIMTNMGGAEGMKSALAPVAAQSLISQLGLKQAVVQSRDYKKNFIMHGQDPIKELELNKKLNGNSPIITLSSLAKSTVSPISGVDMSKLGDSANVGFMKSNFLGDAKDSSKEIETRSSALLEAAGVDMKDTLGDKLPTALKVKLDPLILGMQDNPQAEEVRLVTMLKNTNREEEPELYKRILEKIDLTRAIVQDITPKKGLTQGETDRASNELTSIVGQAFGVTTKTGGSVNNPFVSFKDMKEKNLIALKGVNYYMAEYQKSKLNSGKDDYYNNYMVIRQAAAEGKKVISTRINGIYSLEVDNASFYDEDDLTKLAIKREGAEAKVEGSSNAKTPEQVRKENKEGKNNPDVTISTLIPEIQKLRSQGADSRVISNKKALLIEAIGKKYGIKSYKEANEKLAELIGSGNFDEITS